MVHDLSTAIRDVIAGAEIAIVECWCGEHSDCSLLCTALFVSPYRKQAPLVRLASRLT